MYDVLDLLRRAAPGLHDLVANARERGGRLCTGPILRRVWGPFPRLSLFAVALVAIAYCALVPAGSVHLPYASGGPSPVLLFSLAVGWSLRRALLAGGPLAADGRDSPREMFRALGWTLIPGMLVVAVGIVVLQALDAAVPEADTTPELLSRWGTEIVVGAEHVLRYCAAIAVVLGALTFARNWFGALLGLFVAFLVFGIVLWLMRFLFLVIAPLGHLTNWVLGALLAWTLPGWAIDTMDRLAHAGFMALIDLALIGCAWSVGLNGFGRLLEKGEVDFVSQLQGLAGGKVDEEA